MAPPTDVHSPSPQVHFFVRIAHAATTILNLVSHPRARRKRKLKQFVRYAVIDRQSADTNRSAVRRAIQATYWPDSSIRYAVQRSRQPQTCLHLVKLTEYTSRFQGPDYFRYVLAALIPLAKSDPVANGRIDPNALFVPGTQDMAFNSLNELQLAFNPPVMVNQIQCVR
jgi:hypothetical protein